MVLLLSKLPKSTARKKKRLGRGIGSGKGSKSGRGTTRHQKARENIPLHFEGGQAKMVKKFPLLRGKSKNKSIKQKETVVSLESLNVLKTGETVSLETLTKYKVIDNVKVKVKIVANGKLEKKLTVQLPASKKAQKLIEKAGGTVKT